MTIGVSLSGGGARGISHLGLLEVFAEHDIKVSAISGSSAGAILGALYAGGHSPREILEIVEKSQLYRYIRPSMTSGGLLNLHRTERIFRKYLPHDSFESLKIPLHVAATDINRGKTHFFSTGAVIKPLIASSSIPVIFSPVHIDGTDYIDGGILNNLPVEPLLENCDKVIGLSCNPIGDQFTGRNIKELLERSLLLAISQNTLAKTHLCDLFIEPPGLAKYKVFDFGKAQDIFQVGYEYGQSIVSKLEALKAPI